MVITSVAFIIYVCICLLKQNAFAAITVSFKEPVYIFSEDDEQGKLVIAITIILSNPSSADVNIIVFSTDGTACGEHF